MRVAAPLADNNPWLDEDVDWERTIAYRHYLWDLGIRVWPDYGDGLAQRGMGLSWGGAQELIRRSLEAARGRKDAVIACVSGDLTTRSRCAGLDEWMM